MNGSQHALTSLTPNNSDAADDAAARWFADEDMALGCECANPALQIERWGQEAPQLLQGSC